MTRLRVIRTDPNPAWYESPRNILAERYERVASCERMLASAAVRLEHWDRSGAFERRTIPLRSSRRRRVSPFVQRLRRSVQIPTAYGAIRRTARP